MARKEFQRMLLGRFQQVTTPISYLEYYPLCFPWGPEISRFQTVLAQSCSKSKRIDLDRDVLQGNYHRRPYLDLSLYEPLLLTYRFVFVVLLFIIDLHPELSLVPRFFHIYVVRVYLWHSTA